MKIYCDGSGYNGKNSGFAVCFENELIKKVYDEKNRTNNEAEYEAVIYALRLADRNDEIYTDSMLVVQQGNGNWKVKEERLIVYVEKVKMLLKEKECKLLWIKRDYNKAGKYFE
jgi:ribonuclease HI